MASFTNKQIFKEVLKAYCVAALFIGFFVIGRYIYPIDIKAQPVSCDIQERLQVRGCEIAGALALEDAREANWYFEQCVTRLNLWQRRATQAAFLCGNKD